MKKVFIYLRNEEKGPFTVSQLKAQGVELSTLVRYEGTSNWVAAGQFPEIRQALLTGNSTGANRTAPPRRRSSEIIMPSHSDAEQAAKARRAKAITFLIGAAAVACGAGFFLSKMNKPAYTPPATHEQDQVITEKDNSLRGEDQRKTTEEPLLTGKENEVAHPAQYLNITTAFKHNPGGKDIVSGTVTSSAIATTYQGVEITVFYLDDAGTALDTEVFFIDQPIAPGRTINYKFATTAPNKTASTDVAFNEAKL